MTLSDVTAFDVSERRTWAGRADAYEGGFGRLCAYPVPFLLDAAGTGAGIRLLDVGTGPGTVAAAARERGALTSAVDAEPAMVDRAMRRAPETDVRLAALPDLPFTDDHFDAVVGNFVLNHVGRPRTALAELSRVTRPGGRIALTIWAAPPAAGQTLLGRAVEAAGAKRPPHLPALAPEDDFPRSEEGLVDLLASVGLTDAGCRTLRWDHHATPDEWWSGPAAGVATIGQTIISQPTETITSIKRHFDVLSAEFTGDDGRLALPHAALLCWARTPA